MVEYFGIQFILKFEGEHRNTLPLIIYTFQIEDICPRCFIYVRGTENALCEIDLQRINKKMAYSWAKPRNGEAEAYHHW